MRVLAAVILSCVALVLSGGPSLASDATQDMGRVVKLPETAADHTALVESYQKNAATWRQEAAYHREMAALYQKSHGPEDSATMNKHCATIAKDSDKLAKEAEDMANYHRVRAKNLQGK